MAGPNEEATAPTVAAKHDDVSHEETLPASPTAPGAPLPVDASSLATVPASVYTILGEHGRGGLGRILRARDERTGRVVAIKEILDGTVDAAARFVREALVTANLQHPAIVPVYEVGRWPSGQPFYAMKLVAGRTLSAAITDGLDLRARLALVPHIAAVADALAYAHEAGVIHRDLKPSNVLVGSFGETVVIDWGLAKRTGDRDELPLPEIASSETQSGSVMGTPAYMPPEQAIGEAVDARADVYAIGAMLYHLLAGAPPYADSKNAADVITRVRTGKPPAPLASLVPDVAPDLAAIVDKAMARNASARYPSASELAADLRTFMNGGLVGAHRYTTRQRIARWIRRHRAPVAIAALATVALGGFGAYSIARIVRERDAAERANHLATLRKADTEDLADFMLRDMHDRLEQVGRLDLLEPIARKTILHYDLGHMRGEPRSSSEARAHKRLGDVFLRRSDSEHALAEYRRAKEIMSSVAASHPEKLPLRRDLAVLDDNIADVLAARGDVDGALAAYRGALAVFVDLTHLDPKERQFQTDVAFAHMRIGSLLQTRGDQRGSLDELRAARAIEAELARAQPDDLGSRSMLSTLDNEIGDALDSLGDHDGALASYESARDLAIAIAASSPTPEHRRDVMVALYKLAQVYRHHGERDLAADNTRRALEIARANAAHDPDNAIWKRDIEINESDLGDDLRAGGRLDDTQAAYDDVLAIATDIAAHDPSSADAQWDLANALERVGNLDLQRKHLDRAAERYQAAFEIHTREAARDPSSAEWQRGVAISHTKLSDVALARGDTATAVAEARTAQTLARRIADASKSAGAQTDLASVDQQLGKTLLAAHDKSAAVEALREAIELLEPLAAKNPEVAKDLGDLRADLARALGR